MKLYKKFVEILNTVFLWVSVALLIVVMCSSIIQVFTRTVLNNALVGTEEVARYAFIWVSFLGSSLALAKIGTHPTVDILNNALKDRAKHIHLIFTYLVVLLFGVVLVIHGGRLTSVVMRQLSPTLRLPMAFVYGACPAGGVGIILNALAVIFDQIEALKNPPEETEKTKETEKVKETKTAEGGAAS